MYLFQLDKAPPSLEDPHLTLHAHTAPLNPCYSRAFVSRVSVHSNDLLYLSGVL